VPSKLICLCHDRSLDKVSFILTMSRSYSQRFISHISKEFFSRSKSEVQEFIVAVISDQSLHLCHPIFNAEVSRVCLRIAVKTSIENSYDLCPIKVIDMRLDDRLKVLFRIFERNLNSLTFISIVLKRPLWLNWSKDRGNMGEQWRVASIWKSLPMHMQTSQSL
jgi:hypothetical protein